MQCLLAFHQAAAAAQHSGDDQRGEGHNCKACGGQLRRDSGHVGFQCDLDVDPLHQSRRDACPELGAHIAAQRSTGDKDAKDTDKCVREFPPRGRTERTH